MYLKPFAVLILQNPSAVAYFAPNRLLDSASERSSFSRFFKKLVPFLKKIKFLKKI